MRATQLLLVAASAMLTACGSDQTSDQQAAGASAQGKSLPAGIELLPDLPVGIAAISMDASSYTQRKYDYETGEATDIPREAETAQLHHAMAVRYVDAEGESTLHLLFSDQQLEGVRLRDPFGGSGFPIWRRQGDPKYLYLEKKAQAEGFSGLSNPGPGISDVTVADLNEANGRLQGTVEFTVEARVDSEPSLVATGTFEMPLTEVHPSPAVSCEEGLDEGMLSDLGDALDAIAAADLDRVREAVTPRAYADLEVLGADEGPEAILRMVSFIAVPIEQVRAMCESGEAQVYRAGHLVKFEYETNADDGSTESGSFVLEWHTGRWRLSS